LTIGQRYNRSGQSAAKTLFAGGLGAIHSAFQRFKLAEFDRALVSGPGDRTTEQAQRDFARQISESPRFDTKRA
jgi:hypothetical protein